MFGLTEPSEGKGGGAVWLICFGTTTQSQKCLLPLLGKLTSASSPPWADVLAMAPGSSCIVCHCVQAGQRGATTSRGIRGYLAGGIRRDDGRKLEEGGGEKKKEMAMCVEWR